MKTRLLSILFLLVSNASSAQNFTEVTETPFEGVAASSIAFSDIDGDNDQDVLITGRNSYNEYEGISKLYSNDGSGNFTEVTGTPFQGAYYSSIAFSDIDGDNDQDVLITGIVITGPISKLYSNDGSGHFTEVMGTPFEGVGTSSIAFSDIDGDNDQDLLITGSNIDNDPICKLYSNDGSGNFTEVTETPFLGINNGSIAFSDIDGDNDQDLLITGLNSDNYLTSKLYSNDGSGNFTEVMGTPFQGVYNSSIAFSDIDGDNDQDVLITGLNSNFNPISKLYSNDGGGNFTEVTGTPFQGAYYSSIAFSDIDGDNDQDVLITGRNNVSKLYSNDGSGNFTEVMGTPFEGVFESSIAFTDIDGDNDQDLLITGENSDNERISKLYTNTPIEGMDLTGNIYSDLSLTITNNKIEISNNTSIDQISLYDVLGHQIGKWTIRESSTIDMNHVITGIYFIEFAGKRTSFTKKISITK